MDGDRYILSIYESISRLTRQMLAAARSSDWDQLVALEKNCYAMFAQLFASTDGRPRSAEFRRRKTELICGVLDDDAQIRMLVEPWLVNLSALIGNTRQQTRLSQAYQVCELTVDGHL